MNHYLVIKHLHLTCVALSGVGFALRGVWMLMGSARLQSPWVRRLPHLVDSLLLASALALATLSGQWPFEQAWLTAKVLALLLYIVLGSMALKRGPTLIVRAAAFALALLVFAYIVGVALTRNPWLF